MEKRGSAKRWVCTHASPTCLPVNHSNGRGTNDSGYHRSSAPLLRARRWSPILVVVSAVLLEVFGDEDHGGRQRDRTNDRADNSDVLAVSNHSAHDQTNEKDDG